MNIVAHAFRLDGPFDLELTRIATLFTDAAYRFAADAAATSDVQTLFRVCYLGTLAGFMYRRPVDGGIDIQILVTRGSTRSPNSLDGQKAGFVGYLPIRDASTDESAAHLLLRRLRAVCPFQTLSECADELSCSRASDIGPGAAELRGVAGVLAQLLRDECSSVGQPEAFERLVAEWLRKEVLEMFNLMVDRRWHQDIC